MTTKALVSGLSGPRLAATVVAGVMCLAVGILTLPQQLTLRLAEAQRLDPPCSARDATARCLRWRGEEARKQADFDVAVSLARRSIAIDPLNVDALELLARSEDPRDVASRKRLVAAIGRYSLQSSYSHYRLLEYALDAKQWDRAMWHADILLRRDAIVADTFYPGLVPLLGSEAGRQAIARRLATAPSWRLAFMQRMAGAAGPEDAMAFYATMSRFGMTPTPVELDSLVARLLDQGQYDGLRRLRRLALPASQTRSLVYDGEFDGLPGPPTLIWETLPVSGGEAVLGSPETDYPGALLLRHDLFSSSDWMARQLILLPPGHYRLSLAVQGLDDQGAKRFAVGIDCRGGANLFTLPLATHGDAWVVSRAEFTVPPDGCQAQWIAFSPITGDRVEMVRVLVDHVAITPSTAPPSVQPLVPQASRAP